MHYKKHKRLREQCTNNWIKDFFENKALEYIFNPHTRITTSEKY